MSAKVPDRKAELPDMSAKVPDRKAELPDMSAKVPDRKAKLPFLSAKVPDMSAIPYFTKTERRGNWGLRIISLYVGVGWFMAYFVPFFNIFIRFVKRPDAAGGPRRHQRRSEERFFRMVSSFSGRVDYEYLHDTVQCAECCLGVDAHCGGLYLAIYAWC